MNEELDRVDATPDAEPVHKKVDRPPRTRFPLKQALWAKILVFVLLGLFLMLIAAGIAESLFSIYGSVEWDSKSEFLNNALKQTYGYSDLSQAQRLYATGLMGTIYDLAGWWLPMVILGAVGAIACLVFLFTAAGHKKGEASVRLNMVDRIPLDLYAALCWAATLGLVVLFITVMDNMMYDAWPYIVTSSGVAFVFLAAIALYIIFLVAIAPFFSFATRIKVGGGIWWRNTVTYRVLKLCWRILKWCGRLVKRFFGGMNYILHKIALVPRTALIVAGAMLLDIILSMNILSDRYFGSAFMFLLWFLYNVALFVALCFGAWQMKSLKAAGERMARGEIDEKIDTQHMYWEFKKHAENLNSIGDGMAAAVEQRMKSERLKTELITNVSHDIKTPLTSIVNYVDLLQKPHTPEQESEYLEVLDRQSKRLQKLTEDLVEASKASTGNMNVNLERTNTREIIEQSLAEYGRRMEQGNLTVIVNIPDEAPRAMADGRLLWRVLDNLFNNVCKYALAGTRVYIDAGIEGNEAVISVKNISRDPLNVSADELMERFVRGDSSRHTEGSGLGLNIAQSLVNLMHGKFSLSVDGDLFKAEIRLPKAK